MAIALSAIYDDPDSPDDARDKFLNRLKATNLPNKIANSDSRSHLAFDDGFPRVTEQRDGFTTVHAKGTIQITVAGVQRPQGFDVSARVRAVRRNSLYALGTLGVQVIDVWEN